MVGNGSNFPFNAVVDKGYIIQASGVADASSLRFFTINKFEGTKPKFTFNCSTSFSVVETCCLHVLLIFTVEFSYFRLRFPFLAIVYIFGSAVLCRPSSSACEEHMESGGRNQLGYPSLPSCFIIIIIIFLLFFFYFLLLKFIIS